MQCDEKKMNQAEWYRLIGICSKWSIVVCSDAEIYRLRHDEHVSLVKRLQSSIEAHVRLLDKVQNRYDSHFVFIQTSLHTL